jgi:hypothetical protein
MCKNRLTDTSMWIKGTDKLGDAMNARDTLRNAILAENNIS